MWMANRKIYRQREFGASNPFAKALLRARKLASISIGSVNNSDCWCFKHQKNCTDAAIPKEIVSLGSP